MYKKVLPAEASVEQNSQEKSFKFELFIEDLFFLILDSQ